MPIYQHIALLFLLGMSSGVHSASQEQIMQLYNSQPIGTVVKCQAHMNVKSGNTAIPIQVISTLTENGRQFGHTYYDSEITYFDVNAAKPYMSVFVSVDSEIQEEHKRIRTELDLASLRVHFPGNPEMGKDVYKKFQQNSITYTDYTDITFFETMEYMIREYSKDVTAGVIIHHCMPVTTP